MHSSSPSLPGGAAVADGPLAAAPALAPHAHKTFWLSRVERRAYRDFTAARPEQERGREAGRERETERGTGRGKRGAAA